MLSMLKFVAKAGLGVGAVYITIEQGVWGSSEESEKVLNKVLNTLDNVPGLKGYREMIPNKNDLCYKSVHYWNSGVQYTFAGLAAIPSVTGSLTTKGMDMVKDFVKSASQK